MANQTQADALSRAQLMALFGETPESLGLTDMPDSFDVQTDAVKATDPILVLARSIDRLLEKAIK